MLIFVSVLHVLLCVFMVFVILLQPGKDAGMGAALGGGAATSAFGGRGAVTFLGKVTAVCAIAFFVTSLGLSLKDLRRSVTAAAEPPAPASAPADQKAEDGAAAPADPVATQPAPPAPADALNQGSEGTGTPVPAVDPKAAQGTEGVPGDKVPQGPGK